MQDIVNDLLEITKYERGRRREVMNKPHGFQKECMREGGDQQSKIQCN